MTPLENDEIHLITIKSERNTIERGQGTSEKTVITENVNIKENCRPTCSKALTKTGKEVGSVRSTEAAPQQIVTSSTPTFPILSLAVLILYCDALSLRMPIAVIMGHNVWTRLLLAGTASWIAWFLSKKLTKAKHEDRQRTGRYLAVGVILVMLFIAFYHTLMRHTTVFAGLIAPAAIMLLYILWLLYFAKKRKREVTTV